MLKTVFDLPGYPRPLTPLGREAAREPLAPRRLVNGELALAFHQMLGRFGLTAEGLQRLHAANRRDVFFPIPSQLLGKGLKYLLEQIQRQGELPLRGLDSDARKVWGRAHLSRRGHPYLIELPDSMVNTEQPGGIYGAPCFLEAGELPRERILCIWARGTTQDSTLLAKAFPLKTFKDVPIILQANEDSTPTLLDLETHQTCDTIDAQLLAKIYISALKWAKTFAHILLQPGDLVLDVGPSAHIFSALAAAMMGALVHVVQPREDRIFDPFWKGDEYLEEWDQSQAHYHYVRQFDTVTERTLGFPASNRVFYKHGFVQAVLTASHERYKAILLPNVVDDLLSFAKAEEIINAVLNCAADECYLVFTAIVDREIQYALLQEVLTRKGFHFNEIVPFPGTQDSFPVFKLKKVLSS